MVPFVCDSFHARRHRSPIRQRRLSLAAPISTFPFYLGVLGAFAVFGFVLGIPDRIQEFFSLANTDWRVGFLSISSFFGGFYAARWFVRAAFRLLDRHLPREQHSSPTAMA